MSTNDQRPLPDELSDQDFDKPFENPLPIAENLTAILTCLGAKTSIEDSKYILQRQNPFGQRRGGLGFGAYAVVRMFNGASTFTNINVFNKQAQISPLRLRMADKENGNFVLEDENGRIIADGRVLPIPSWGKKLLSTGKPAITVLQQHGPVNLVGVLGDSKCSLFETGDACQFCMLDGGTKNENRSVEEILEAFELACSDRLNYNLTLTTGIQASRGDAVDLVGAVKIIKQRIGESALAVEVVPFAQNSQKILKALKEVGLDTFMMPLDCATYEAQCRYLPGKASLLGEIFWENARNAVEIFGKGNVTSSIIIGLEPLADTLVAMARMLDEGVIPEPVPVRWDDSKLINAPLSVTNPDDLMKGREIIRNFIQREEIRGTIQKTRAGCAACGGCGGIIVNKLNLPQNGPRIV